VHIPALSEDRDRSEQIGDELLAHQEVQKPSPFPGVPEESQHEEHERDSTKRAAHDCWDLVSCFFLLNLDCGEEDVALTHRFGDKDKLHCLDPLAVSEEEEMPSPAMCEG